MWKSTVLVPGPNFPTPATGNAGKSDEMISVFAEKEERTSGNRVRRMETDPTFSGSGLTPGEPMINIDVEVKYG